MKTLRLLAGLGLCLIAAPAPAQRAARTSESPATPAPTTGRIAARFGVDAVQRSLASDDPALRELALERLGAIGSARALAVLSAAVEADGAARTTRERLIAVRALAPHAALPEARLALLRAMSGGSAEAARDELARLVQHTAALALAASHSDPALAALGKALRQEGPLAEVIADALEAHPPEALGPLLATPGAATPTLVRVLGNLGDQRAFFELRRAIRRGGPAVRAEAALALTRLGDFETVELARHWQKTERVPELRLAAARILGMAHTPDAPAAVLGLLRDTALADAGLELALEMPNAQLIPELEARIERSHPDELPAVLGALSRAGAAEALERALKLPKTAALAAHALALAPGPAARDALERALDRASTRRLAARAAAFREAVLGERVAGSSEALSSLLASSDAADRAAGAWGSAIRDPDRARELIASRDVAIVRAAARAALDPRVAVVAAERLTAERDSATQAALALSLAVPAAADRVPTRILIELFEAAGPAAPFAARALAARNTTDLLPRIELLLESSDELVRAHVALGLAESDNPRALAWLARSYRFETSARVRRAIVVAMSRRPEHSRQGLLKLAAALDADRDVRQNARRALAGERLDAGGRGSSGAWITLEPNASGALDAAAGRPLLLETAGGLALPVVTDPDGIACIAPLAQGPIRVRLAAPAIRGKPGGTR